MMSKLIDRSEIRKQDLIENGIASSEERFKQIAQVDKEMTGAINKKRGEVHAKSRHGMI